MEGYKVRYDVVVRGGLVIYPEKTVRADIGIQNGTIEKVSS